VLACWGLLLPPQTVQADGTPVVSRPAQPSAADVALDPTGVLEGHVYTPQGKPVDGATVTLMQGENVITHTNTDTRGAFAVAQLEPGVYQVIVGATHGAPIRVWNAETAPPSARTRAIFVVGKPVVRGQSCPNGCPDGYCTCGAGGGFFGLDCITLVTLGASITAAVLAGLNQKDIDDLEEKINRLVSP
jgi:hypothetical protein